MSFSQKQLLAEKIQERAAYGAMVRDPDEIAEDLEELFRVQEVIQLLEFLMDVEDLQEWIEDTFGELQEPEEF